MPRVLVIGSANMDFTVAVPRLPAKGETVTGGSFYVSHGGKGANQAVAARRLGGDVRFVGCVGQDPQGDQVVDQLAAEGIPTDGVIRTEAATGVALITVDGEGRNQIAVASGANLELLPDLAKMHASLMPWAKVLLLQLGIAVAAPDSASQAAQHLLARGVRRVIVTLGARGVLYCDGKSALHFPAFPVDAVDTTGAGDAFNAALAIGLAAGGAWEEALPLANAAAALTCTRRGAQTSFPRRADVEAFMRQLKRK